MIYVVQYNLTYDVTWDNVDIVIWSVIEEAAAMLCATLPTLRLIIVNTTLSFRCWGGKAALTTQSTRRALSNKGPPGQEWDFFSSSIPITNTGGQRLDLVPQDENTGIIVTTSWLID